MADHVIPLVDHRHSARLPARPVAAAPAVSLPPGDLIDALARPLRDLRISVTDRCNFRCSYCMPKAVFGRQHAFLPQSALLNFEEITRLARLFVAQGVRKIRLTGGEPLLRKQLPQLVAQLAELRTHDGQRVDLALTTNGALLARQARALHDAGLQRITVSLDALDDAIFRRMNDVDFPVAEVLVGINAAQAAGFAPLKINMVVKRGVNDHQIVPMARHFAGRGMVLRFIEYMDVGVTNGWRLDDVLPSADVLQQLGNAFSLTAIEPGSSGETAQRWRYASPTDGTAHGEIGLISSVTQAFCHACNRARLSTEGQLFLCLFASQGHDLRALLRQGHDDAEITAALQSLWQGRSDRYSALRSQHPVATVPSPTAVPPRVEMHYIGG